MTALAARIAELRDLLDRTYGQRSPDDWTEDERRTHLVPPASDAEIRAFEEEHGTSFPPSYRAFLKITNGWTNFVAGMTLVGVSGGHTARVLADVADNAEQGEVPELVPLATDFGGALWFFDGDQVVYWTIDGGVDEERRYATFDAFLDEMRELAARGLELAGTGAGFDEDEDD